MSDLDHILLRQKILQTVMAERESSFVPPGTLGEEVTVGEVYDYVKSTAFHLSQEIDEMLEELSEHGRDIHKPWKKVNKALRAKRFEPSEKIKEESIDALCFMINILLCVGVDSTNLKEEYDRVWSKNMGRVKGGY